MSGSKINQGGGEEDPGWMDITSNPDVASDAGDAEDSSQADDREAGSESEGAEDKGAPTAGDETVSTDGDQEEFITVDGQKIAIGELDPATIRKMATHYGKVSTYQKLADERKAEVERLQQEQQSVINDYLRRKMIEEERDRQRQEWEHQRGTQYQPPPRPNTEALLAHFKPYVDSLKEQGRITVDEADEHSGLIAEYLYDSLRTAHTIEQVARYFDNRIAQVEQQFFPDLQRRAVSEAQASERAILTELTSREGYESLSDPNEWNRLKTFIAEKVARSPRDAQGNPTFDPVFDAETMAQMYDAMCGADMRKLIASQRKAAAGNEAVNRRRSQGSPTSGRGGKTTFKGPAPKRTPEDDALDFSDPSRAMG